MIVFHRSDLQALSYFSSHLQESEKCLEDHKLFQSEHSVLRMTQIPLILTQFSPAHQTSFSSKLFLADIIDHLQ